MGDIVRGSTFTDGVTNDATAAKLHALIESAVIQPSFVIGKTSVTPTPSDSVTIYDASGAVLARCTLAQLVAIAGTVKSVGVSAPADLLSVASSPVTGSGTIALSKVNQTAGKVYAAPSAATGLPTFRTLTPGDVTPDYTPVTTPTAATGLDCSVSSAFSVTVSRDTTISFSGYSVGQTIYVWFVNASSYAVTWSGVSPTTLSDPVNYQSAQYRFFIGAGAVPVGEKINTVSSVTANFSGATTLDVSTARYFKMTATGNGVLSFTNDTPGQTIILTVATAGHTVNWGTFGHGVIASGTYLVAFDDLHEPLVVALNVV